MLIGCAFAGILSRCICHTPKCPSEPTFELAFWNTEEPKAWLWSERLAVAAPAHLLPKIMPLPTCVLRLEAFLILTTENRVVSCHLPLYVVVCKLLSNMTSNGPKLVLNILLPGKFKLSENVQGRIC
jgi:hypothetical protein